MPTRHWRSCYTCKKNCYTKEVQLKSDLEAAAITLIINNKKAITICNIYLSNRYEIDIAKLQNLIEQLPSSLILAGDFKSHNEVSNKQTKEDALQKKF